MMIKSKICGEFPNRLYRFYSNEKYANDFAENGIFRLTRIEEYHSSDVARQDISEGEGYFKTEESGCHYFSPEKKEIYPCSGKDIVENNIIHLEAIFLISFTFPTIDVTYMKNKFGSFMVIIEEPKQFALDIENYLLERNEKFMIQGVPIRYNKGLMLPGNILDHETADLSFTQKHQNYAKEKEFRIVFRGLGVKYLSENDERKFIDINFGKKLSYVSKQW